MTGRTCYHRRAAGRLQGFRIRKEVRDAMRCSCKECGTYMVQCESDHQGCVCPECGYRCADCLGTNTVVSRDSLKSLAFDPRFSPEALMENFTPEAEEEDTGGGYTP